MTRPLRVGLLLFPNCMPAGLFAFADLLHAANQRTGKSLFEVRYVALKSGPVVCAHEVSLDAPYGLERSEVDALLVPGFWAESADQVEQMLAAQVALVKALSRLGRSVQLWSYCTGVCLLAASGRLARRAATVTWWLADFARRRFTNVRWQSEQSCVFDVLVTTASGVSGYLPIAQGLIERSVSAQVFSDLTKLMVLPRPTAPHVAFQGTSLMEQPAGLLRKLHGLIERMPAEQLTVQVLASRLGMSERTLARRVRSETEYPVATYARRIKLNQVSERLTLTSLPVTTISAELGFSSDANLRRMFKELTGHTPAHYRQLYGRV